MYLESKTPSDLGGARRARHLLKLGRLLQSGRFMLWIPPIGFELTKCIRSLVGMEKTLQHLQLSCCATLTTGRGALCKLS